MNLNLRIVRKYVLLSVFFIVASAAAAAAWNHVSLPFSNPWNVAGKLSETGFNPLNNSLRFAFLLFSPILLLALGYLLDIGNFNNICFGSNRRIVDFFVPEEIDETEEAVARAKARKKYLFWVLVLAAAFSALFIPTDRSSGKFDIFHEGESLGTAMSYISGKAPYRDFIFAHGAYQDPLRSAAAFSLFGTSVGAARSLESAVKLAAFALLMAFLIRIFKRNMLESFVAYAALFIAMASVPQALIVIPRDVTLFAFLGAAAALQDFISGENESGPGLTAAAFLFVFIPLASLGYSVDRGVYLTITCLLAIVPTYIFFIRKSRFRANFLLGAAAAVVFAALFLGVIMRWQFAEFLRFTFAVLPRYADLMSGLEYPIAKPAHLLSCLIVTFNAFWFFTQFLKTLYGRSGRFALSCAIFLKNNFLELCALCLSVLAFKNALCRPDWWHVSYSLPLAAVLLLHIALRYYLSNIVNHHKYIFAIIFALPLALITWPGIVLIDHTLASNFELYVDDSEFTPPNYAATLDYLRRNMSPHDEFFTMTSEAAWYYFLKKPCPTRFPVVWFAGPDFYQRALADELARSKVKFILYKNSFWTNAIDGISNERRLPIVYSHIRKNYSFHRKIDDNEIWIRNADASAPRGK